MMKILFILNLLAALSITSYAQKTSSAKEKELAELRSERPQVIERLAELRAVTTRLHNLQDSIDGICQRKLKGKRAAGNAQADKKSEKMKQLIAGAQNQIARNEISIKDLTDLLTEIDEKIKNLSKN